MRVGSHSRFRGFSEILSDFSTERKAIWRDLWQFEKTFIFYIEKCLLNDNFYFLDNGRKDLFFVRFFFAAAIMKSLINEFLYCER